MGFNMRELKVRGYLLHVDRATIASASVDEVRSQETGGPRWFRASAIQHPDDEYEPEVAYLLAFGRALQRLGGYMVKQAEGKVRHLDQRKRSSESAWEKARQEFRARFCQYNNEWEGDQGG